MPCYSALFGPKLFGHGSQVESHQSFGKRYGLCDYLLKIFQINNRTSFSFWRNILKLFSFRSGKKLLIQQQELEKRTREYNDYHNQLIQEKQLNLSLDNSLKNGGNTHSSILHDQHRTSAPTTMSRNTSFVQSSGKSRLEITSREVSVNTSNNLILVLILNSIYETIILILNIYF